MESERIKLLAEEHGLSYQLAFMAEINRLNPLAGRRVLEIGGSNLPRCFVLDALGAVQWICVDHIEADHHSLWPRHYAKEGVISLSKHVVVDQLQAYAILDGQIEDIPTSFANEFDAVVSIAAFEHVLKLGSLLDRVYDVLKPGGSLVSLFSPIWSCHNGHHITDVKDKSGRIFTFNASPIPPWGHLLMRPSQLRRHLLSHTDSESADEMVHQVYHSQNVNRLFVEDYYAYLKESRFTNFELVAVMPSGIPDAIQKKLENLHPGRQRFSHQGLLIKAHK